ncbi:MAG: DUF2778 domain-containing protein [Bradyrhizobium sp.]
MLGVLAAVAVASGAAAWITDPDSHDIIASRPQPAGLKSNPPLSFDERFSAGSASDPLASGIQPRSLSKIVFHELDLKIQQAKNRLAQKLQAEEWRAAFVEQPVSAEEPTAPKSTIVPLPRSRPVVADLEPQSSAAAPVAQPEDRTFLQKLSDLLPAHITLASLAPDGGLLAGRGPNLASLGYDNFTAVYDISAHAVYLPNGSKLEAHSGYGRLMDDPEHVSEHMVGATPPSVYDLKPRERLFHGVEALRMLPVGGGDTLGRTGLLAHSYMLGPNGDSNGCVSIRNYESFLQAYKNGEIKRLVVVPNLNQGATASQRSNSQS